MDSARFNLAFSRATELLASSGDDLDSLPDRLKNMMLVHAAQGVIDNGGLQYFFESDFPRTPDYAIFVDAYRAIGAHDAASLLAEAVDLLNIPQPHLHIRERQQRLVALQGDPSSRFLSIDTALCGDASVWEYLDRYLRENERGGGVS